MTENEALALMSPPGKYKPNAYGGGVIQILVTSSCDKSCYHCTQGSNFRHKPWFMTPDQFRQAVLSLKGFHGVYGLFGGNPAVSKYFREYCQIVRELVPFNQRGIWCNNPITAENAQLMSLTFNPAVSNLNVHMDRNAYNLFKTHWPGCTVVGLESDSSHSPIFVAMKDVLRKPCWHCNGEKGVANPHTNRWHNCAVCNGEGVIYDEPRAWELISNCDINQLWSAGIGVFRGELRAWFCEVAMAQSILHQHEEYYPDTGIDPTLSYSDPYDKSDLRSLKWWQLPMSAFANQVKKHCHECSVPLRGIGELAQSTSSSSREQISVTHESIAKTKDKNRRIELVVVSSQLGHVPEVTKYLQNSKIER